MEKRTLPMLLRSGTDRLCSMWGLKRPNRTCRTMSLAHSVLCLGSGANEHHPLSEDRKGTESFEVKTVFVQSNFSFPPRTIK